MCVNSTGMPGNQLHVVSLLPHVKLIMIAGLLLQPMHHLKIVELMFKKRGEDRPENDVAKPVEKEIRTCNYRGGVLWAGSDYIVGTSSPVKPKMVANQGPVLCRPQCSSIELLKRSKHPLLCPSPLCPPPHPSEAKCSQSVQTANGLINPNYYRFNSSKIRNKKLFVN